MLGIKRSLFFALILFVNLSSNGQSPGDTIRVQGFSYPSQTRDTIISFPPVSSVTYHKILMLYNMRCKDGNVSQPYTGQTNIGCGEWDYSCNTYITDSSRTDSVISSHKSHDITNFSGNTYPYVTQELFYFYRHIQSNTSGTTITSETQSTINCGSLPLNHVIACDENSGKSQYLYTQGELNAAGVITGDIDGIILNSLSNSNVHFLRIRIKHSSLTSLSSSSIDTSGFTECYFLNTSFNTGGNRIQFHTPFNWNGTSNIIIEMSFTNSVVGSALQIEGGAGDSTLGAYSNNQYHINTSSGATMGVPTSSMNSIVNEISVSMWVNGNAGTSTNNTSVIGGRDSSFNRQLNVHLPWSNTSVYFDCGGIGSSYDRIYTSSNSGELEGSWNHWAFTKNATSGDMKVYLNGNLWHSGTGKTNAISLDTMILGAEAHNAYIYSGKIDELRIWNTELGQTTIQNWMNTSVNASHPDYASLVAYYPLNEGVGNNSSDLSINGLSGSFLNNAVWEYVRGVDLNRFFTTTKERPSVTFLQGTYSLSVINDTILDSIPKLSNTVTAYQIISKSGTQQHDSIGVVSINSYWEALNEYVYDAVSGIVVDSFIVSAIDTIHIIDLDYYSRYPSKYEIMSFVTPYGINLDLGMDGKTWVFDVTDYGPILNGNKRISVERGGQWQENMDISFLFLVGTPVMEVLDVKQLWRSTNSRSYSSIIEDRYFPPVNIYIDTNVVSAKLRSVITGHGQEGEFIARSHYLDLDGGTDEFVWTEWTECAENPVYPQGGTWIYDRAGWCPGMPSDVSEFDISSYITSGDSIQIDYGMYTASGTSNYLVNNQLVTYGGANFNLDAAIIDVVAPSNRVEFFRSNSICTDPTINIQNTGTTTLTSLEIEYWVNGATQKESYTWSGNLAFLEKEEIVLPAPESLWDNINITDNTFFVEINNPNGNTDEYIHNNNYISDFTISKVIPSDFYLLFKTNNAASETKYELFDDVGNILYSRTNLTNNTIYRDTFNIGVGCYRFVVTDTDDDGIDFWANNDGAGYAFFRQIGGGNLHKIEGDFGGSIIFNFTVDFPLSYEDLHLETEYLIYPNPAKNKFYIESSNIESAIVTVYNIMGQKVDLSFTYANNTIIFDCTETPKGIYVISILQNGTYYNKKIILE
jgi:Concanavalin A-like lectin/glucanases superfamily/Peptide-N-glycosidase F, C terminal/Secretion system C-terminal sorting domain